MDYVDISPIRNRGLIGSQKETIPSKVYYVRGLKKVPKRLKQIPEVEKDLPFGRKSGILSIGPHKPIGKARLYATICDCGRHNLSTAEQIWYNLEAGLGCGEDDCTAVALSEKLWRNSEDSLKLQLMTRLAVTGDDVFSYWGGRLDDGFSLSVAEGVNNFTQYCLSKMRGKLDFWAHKECPSLPFIEGNIVMQTQPDPLFYRIAKMDLNIAGSRYGVKELADIMGLTEADVVAEFLTCASMEDLIKNLANRS